MKLLDIKFNDMLFKTSLESYFQIKLFDAQKLIDANDLLKQKVIEYLNNPEMGTREIEKLIPDWEIKK